MTAPALIPMLCTRCQNPILANPAEAAWVCDQCGQGLLLTPSGLAPIEIHYAAGIAPNAKGRPFWVAQGQAALQRQTFHGNQSREADLFWQNPRWFCVPAFNLPLDQLVSLGVQLLRQPPQWQPGSPAPFYPVTVLPDDVRPLAEFIVVGIEAERKDDLRELRISLTMQPPQLWIVP
jgi:hypothetical protein